MKFSKGDYNSAGWLLGIIGFLLLLCSDNIIAEFFGLVCLFLCLCAFIAAKSAATTRTNIYPDRCTFTKRSIFDKDVTENATDEFVVLDFETTGLDRENDRIIEISARRYIDGDKSVSSYNTLVNPGRRIPAESTEIHHITNRMVKDAPSEYDAIRELHRFIGEDIIAAHNADFDIEFLRHAYNRAGLEATNDYIDTLAISRKLYQLANYKLGSVGRHLGFSTDGLHRAGNDTEICGAIVIDALRHISRMSLFDNMIGEYSDVDKLYLQAVDKVLKDDGISMMMMAVRRTKTFIILSCAGIDWMKIKTTGRLQYVLVYKSQSAIQQYTDGKFEIAQATASEGAGWNRVIITSPEDIPALDKLICSICPAA